MVRLRPLINCWDELLPSLENSVIPIPTRSALTGTVSGSDINLLYRTIPEDMIPFAAALRLKPQAIGSKLIGGQEHLFQGTNLDLRMEMSRNLSDDMIDSVIGKIGDMKGELFRHGIINKSAHGKNVLITYPYRGLIGLRDLEDLERLGGLGLTDLTIGSRNSNLFLQYNTRLKRLDPTNSSRHEQIETYHFLSTLENDWKKVSEQ